MKFVAASLSNSFTVCGFLILVLMSLISLAQAAPDRVVIPKGKNICVVKGPMRLDGGEAVYAFCDGVGTKILSPEKYVTGEVFLTRAVSRFIDAGYILKNCTDDSCVLTSK